MKNKRLMRQYSSLLFKRFRHRAGETSSFPFPLTFPFIFFVLFSFSSSLSYKASAQDDDTADRKAFDTARSLGVFNSVIRELRMLYVDDFDVDKSVTTAIDAMLDELDPYTVYYPVDETEELGMMTTGKYAGVGAIIRQLQKSKQVVVSEPYEDMPAQKAGLKAGDILLRIDTTDLKGMNTEQVSNLLRGETGTDVNVTYHRPGESEDHTVRITRAAIQLPAVPYYGMVNDSTGYILFERFIDGCSRDVRLAIVALREQGAKRLILDLRGNGGGLVSEAVEIVNLFVPKDQPVVETRGRLPQTASSLRTTHAAIEPELPLIVLVDGQTASAAEIVSGALQDLDRAVIVGSRTYGKGLVQAPRELPYGASLKITTSKYYIPSGRCIQAIDYAVRDEDGQVTRIPDSLTTVYHTAAGREVRDGCGISPDVEVKGKKMPSMLYYLANDDCMFNFATAYASTHPEMPSPETFVVDDELYAAFCDSLRASGFTYDRGSVSMLSKLREWAEFEGYMESAKDEFAALEARLSPDLDGDLQRHAEDIRLLLADELITRYYYQRGAIILALRTDDGLKAALDLAADPSRYDSLLTPPAKETTKQQVSAPKEKSKKAVSTGKKQKRKKSRK